MERYDNLDGLRAISCIGIIAMHIQANTSYQITGWIWERFIPSLTLLVYLFLMLSGFSMFCGYYAKVKNNQMDLNRFYAKRYQKVLPFFAVLILLDLIMDRSINSLIEGITEATLVFGLLPNNNLSVIGVSWTLGVIFLFYMLFPYFVWICWTKRRAWIALAISSMLTVFCSQYFFTEQFVIEGFANRHNFLYCVPYFLVGGIIFLYRREIKAFVSRHKVQSLVGCIAITVLYYTVIDSRIDSNDPGIILLLLYVPWLCYAISVSSRILNNTVMKYLSGISLEIYLGHMVIFRVIEKMQALYIGGTGWLSFIVVWAMVVVGLIVFIEIYRYVVRWFLKWMIRN